MKQFYIKPASQFALIITLFNFLPLSCYTKETKNTVVEKNEYYFIIGAGQSKQKSSAATGNISISSTKTSYRFGIGTEFDDDLFIEGYYTQFASTSGSYTGAISGIPVKVNVNIKTSRTLAIQGLYKTNFRPGLDFYGKLGWMTTESRTNQTVPVSPASNTSKSESFSNIFYGFGLQKTLKSGHTFRVEYEIVKFDANDGGDYKLDTIGIYYIHRFK